MTLGWGQGALGIVNDGDDICGGRGPDGFNKEDALVLAADAAAALIGHIREGRGEWGGDNDDGRRQWR